MDTSPLGSSEHLTEPSAAPSEVAPTVSGLYLSSDEALKAVRDDYLYWTGRLTETSLQLSYAIIGANWAVFGSANAVLANRWSRISVGLVIISLGLSVASAKWVGELHREQIRHAESDAARWKNEFRASLGRDSPWPFTTGIERLGRVMREAKTWLPLMAGISFFIALFRH